MNEQIANRAWQKAMEQPDLFVRDWVRGAVCYYRGMSQSPTSSMQIIARDLERALKSFNASNSTAELDHVMKQRLGKQRQYARTAPIPKAIQKAVEQHWARLSTAQIVRKITQNNHEEAWEDKETGVKAMQLSLKDIPQRGEKFDHTFDADTLDRMRRAYVTFGSAAHWESLDEFIDGFYYDMNPFSELRVYERMAEAFRLFFLLMDKAGRQEGSPGPLHPKEMKNLRDQVFNSLLMMTFGKVDNAFGIDEALYMVLGSLYAMNEQGEIFKRAIESDNEL